MQQACIDAVLYQAFAISTQKNWFLSLSFLFLIIVTPTPCWLQSCQNVLFFVVKYCSKVSFHPPARQEILRDETLILRELYKTVSTAAWTSCKMVYFPVKHLGLIQLILPHDLSVMLLCICWEEKDKTSIGLLLVSLTFSKWTEWWTVSFSTWAWT